MRRVKVFLAWYDLWVGAYVDWPKKLLYLCPLPCLVIRVDIATYYEIWGYGRVVGATSNVGGLGDLDSHHAVKRISKREYERLFE